MKETLEFIENIQFPQPDTLWQRKLSNLLRNATLELRRAYYKACPVRNDVYQTPFGGPITDSIGPWPEFILRGLPCQKSKKGCCAPCFYSRIPQVNLPIEKIYESLIQQTSYILDNFESYVRANQFGPVAFSHAKLAKVANQPLAFVLTPTGSFFDEMEFPTAIREKILRMLTEYAHRNSWTFALHIETHAEDFLYAAEEKEKFQQTISLLKKLHGRVLFGFESANDFVRNVLYNKFLDYTTFSTAITLAKQLGLGVGAFVFVGMNPLTDVEILADAVATLNCLTELKICPVLMFHNIQPYTIQELLLRYRVHRLPEPRTVLEVVHYLTTKFPAHNDGQIDTWLIADPIGGPPPPKDNIFSAKESVTCKTCSKAIYEEIVALRTTRDIIRFTQFYEKISQCECSMKYLDLLKAQVTENKNLLERVEMMAKIVNDKLGDYISVIRPILNEAENYAVFDDAIPKEIREKKNICFSDLKAELLCYGLRIDNNIEADLVAFNSYVKEAGFVHAAHFLVNGRVVNACVAERFCSTSPYLLVKNKEQYQLQRDGEIIGPCEIMRLPPWCKEPIGQRKMGDVLRPHSPNVISGMPNSKCCYFQAGTECSFCSLGSLQKIEPVDPKDVAEVALFALKHNPSYELALSGGTPATPDRGAVYFADICNHIRKKSGLPISVEMVPPDTNDYIDYLYEAGITSLIMNVEIWDQRLRSTFCPGKSEISLDRYLDAIEYAVKRFGRGQVASVLIAGLQEHGTLIDGATEIIRLGAIPTVIPFKPFNECKLSHFYKADASQIVAIYRTISHLLATRGLNPSMQKGCTGCGGCSLEDLTFAEIT